MAILKHISSKNSNYGQALDYLCFQHNESTNKPILDEDGNMVPRKEYYLDGINCDPYMFGIECHELNREWGANQKKNDIKSHQYIISFDPQDKLEGRLTGERAQELGMEFAQKFFPGHQCLVATHTDGNNKSGNIHVHIVLNSIRKFDVPREEWMPRSGDCLAGHKHHLTDDMLKYFKQELMVMCERESLNQVDLITPADRKVTDKEYQQKHREEKENEVHGEMQVQETSAPVETPSVQKSKYKSQKDKIYEAADKVLESATDINEFIDKMYSEYQIQVNVRRGRVAYKPADRKRFVTDKALGARYGFDSLTRIFNENRSKEREIFSNIWDPTLGPMRNDPHHKIHKFDRKYDYKSDPIATMYINSNLPVIQDIQTVEKDKLSKSNNFDVEMGNLQNMVDTITWVERHRYGTMDQIKEVHDRSTAKMNEAENELNDVKNKLTDTNAQIHYMGQYLSNRDTYKQYNQSSNKDQFRKGHEKQLNDYQEAVTWLRDKYKDQRWPSLNDLKSEKQDLTIQRKRLYQSSKYYRDQEKDMDVIEKNVKTILNRPSRNGATERDKKTGKSKSEIGRKIEQRKPQERERIWTRGQEIERH